MTIPKHFTKEDWEARYGRKNNHGQPQVCVHMDINLGEVHNFPRQEVPGFEADSMRQETPNPHETTTDCACVPLVEYIPRGVGTQIVAVRHSFELRGLKRQEAKL